MKGECDGLDLDHRDRHRRARAARVLRARPLPQVAKLTEELVDRLTAAGALGVRPSARREWANFRNAAGDQMQLYWRHGASAYPVVCYSIDGARLKLVGHYYGLEAAIRAATAASATH